MKVRFSGTTTKSGDLPVSTLVEVKALAAPEFLVEIEAVGILGAGKA